MPHASPLTTHVLDTARGKPAAGVAFVLEIGTAGKWTKAAEGVTDSDGRGSLLAGSALVAGPYRLTFATGAWQTGFYPEIAITFTVTDPDQHYHVPLLLSPFGYSTYRGS